MLTDWSENMDMLHTHDQDVYAIWQITSLELLFLLFFKHFLHQWILQNQFWNLRFLSRLHCKDTLPLSHWKSLYSSSKNYKSLCWTPGFPGGSDAKESACNVGDLGLISKLGRYPREACQPTWVFLPRESPWTEEPGRLQSMVSQRVGHDWVSFKCCIPET